jgi:hypothetical protein
MWLFLNSLEILNEVFQTLAFANPISHMVADAGISSGVLNPTLNVDPSALTFSAPALEALVKKKDC